MVGNPGMAGFYKEFMAALHAGLEEEMSTRDSDFWRKERRYSVFCPATFNIY